MEKVASLIYLTLMIGTVYAQGRIVINNDAYINIDNSAYLVIDNPNSNALTISGTGGNILSEDETDVIKWNIGLTTGNYTLPWTTLSGVKIPFIMNKTNSGVGVGHVIFSTYETATDMNVPYPMTVTNMNSGTTDHSLFVADRFWHVDALSYTVKPDVVLSIAYDPAANEIGGMNTIVETNLLAQRFNPNIGSWESLVFGTNDAINDRVINITVPSIDFHENWILVDNAMPLPVTLANFEANCNDNEIEIRWSTFSETNNDYFVVEKSFDAVNFIDLQTIPGVGNSSAENNYVVYDYAPSDRTIYYRLKQVDFNGAAEYHDITNVSCKTDSFEVNQILFNNNNLSFNIISSEREDMCIYFYDCTGKVIARENFFVDKGVNKVTLNNLHISTGIYMLSIVGTKNNYATKLYVE